MKNNRVGIYLENKGIHNVYITDLSLGNCGIGGTRYEILYLIQQIKRSNPAFEFIVFSNKRQNGEVDLEEIIVNSIEDVFYKCNELNIDLLILRGVDGINNLNLLNKARVIYWLHNFINYQSANELAKNNRVACCVFVSKHMYDFYLEHDICKKSVIIYNSIPVTRGDYVSNKIDNYAMYIGNIGAWKGFHELLRLWSKVAKRFPTAVLQVVGSASSNNRNIKLGKLNIADDEYEKKIIKILTKYKIERNVKFLGILGVEKNNYIRECKVGLIPSKRETFCLAATDFVINGVPVIASRTTGLNDTVFNKHTGILIKHKRLMPKMIYKIFNNQANFDFDRSYLDKFSPNAFLSSWYCLIEELLNKNDIIVAKSLPASHPYTDCYKWFGILIRPVRRIFKLSNRFTRLGLRDLIYRLLKI